MDMELEFKLWGGGSINLILMAFLMSGPHKSESLDIAWQFHYDFHLAWFHKREKWLLSWAWTWATLSLYNDKKKVDIEKDIHNPTRKIPMGTSYSNG